MSGPNTHHRPAMANLMCMMSMLVWAVGLPAADLLIGPVPPLQLTAARMAMATVCLLPVWWWLEGGAMLRAARWWRGVWIGGISIGLGAFMLVVGQGLTDSVTVAVISAAMPVIGIGIEVVLDGKKITPNLVVGTVLSLAGGLMALGGVTGGAGLGLGALLCFGAVLMFTVGSRLTVTAFPQLTALGRTTVTLTGATLATGVAAAVSLLLGAPGPNWAVLGLNLAAWPRSKLDLNLLKVVPPRCLARPALWILSKPLNTKKKKKPKPSVFLNQLKKVGQKTPLQN